MMQPVERFVSSNGLRHHVLEWDGGGEAVVLCHGFLDLAWSFDALAQRLCAAGHRVLAFDFRGHGETDWVGPGGYYHFVDYVLDLAGLLPALVDGPVHLLGHSMGGTVACLFAGTFPEQVRTLTLVEGIGPLAQDDDPPERVRTWVRAVDRIRSRAPRPLSGLDEAVQRMRLRTPDLPDALGRFLAEKGTRPADDGPGRVWRFDPLHRTPSPTPFRVDTFRGFLEGITAPVLAVAGEHGYRLPDEDDRLAWLRSRRFVEIPAVGHMIHWLAPDALADALLPFLRDPESV
jgi:pimeloyl-ACP methyl ester carboxylesterase